MREIEYMDDPATKKEVEGGGTALNKYINSAIATKAIEM